jgi:predicted Fe-Mo cluster-binding NifX family protein
MPSRVAITSKSRFRPDSLLDPVFGRAAMFLIIDQGTRKIEAELENPFAAMSLGSGTSAAALMKEHEVDAVITGRFGTKACHALSLLGIEMWNAPDGITVEDAFDRFERGELTRMIIY